jgi:hypothetical protein
VRLRSLSFPSISVAHTTLSITSVPPSLTAFAVGVTQLPFSLLGTGRGLIGGSFGSLVGCSRPGGTLILATAASCSGAPLISGHYSEVCLLLGQLV